MPVRFKAFLLHLAGSAGVALLTLLLVFLLWYPAPLHDAQGVTDVFWLLLLIDVILGPLLTLLVYKAGKRTLVFDMAVIMALQLAALSYGLWTMAEGRPAWIVFNADRFDVVRALDVDTGKQQEASSEYQVSSLLGPRWVAAVLPEDVQQSKVLIFKSMMGGSSTAQLPSLYRPLAEMADVLRDKAAPLQALYSHNADEAVRNMLASWPEADAWLPLVAQVKPMVVLVNRERAEVVAVVDLKPWD